MSTFITSAQRTKLIELYIGYFNRAPEAAGLNYWAGELLTLLGQGKTEQQAFDSIANRFYDAGVQFGVFSNAMTVEQFITTAYQNVLGRSSVDSDGMTYWTQKLTSGEVSRGQFIQQLITEAKAVAAADPQWAWVGTYLANRTAVGDWFANNSAGLTGQDAINAGTAIIANSVTPASAQAGQTAAEAVTAAQAAQAAQQGQTFMLTTGSDTGAAFTGGAGNDTFIGNQVAAGVTWTVGDAIDGGGGTDTFTVTQTGAITIPTGATVKNIENAEFLSGSTVTLNTTTWTGLQQLKSNATGGTTLTAAADVNITATENSVSAVDGNVTINGGKDIALTVTGTTNDNEALNTTTYAGAEIVVGGTTEPTGAVTINSKFTGANTNDAPDIFVKGGTTVNIAQTLGNAVNTTNTFGEVLVVGGANTTAVTVTQEAAATASTTVAGKTNSAVNVVDKNASSTTAAGTITTVTLNNYGNSAINSGALSTVNLSGTGGTLGITPGALTTPAVTTLNLNVKNLSAPSDNSITVNTYKTLNITGTEKASTITNVTGAAVETLNIAGDAKVVLSNNTFTALKSVVSTNTAGVTLGTTALGAGVSFTGGDGDDSIILSNAFTKAITMGKGNDTVTYGGAAGTGGSVNAGDGTDTIVMTVGQADAADNDATFNSTFSGFEVLQLDASSMGGTKTVNLVGINGVNKVVTGAASHALTLDNFANNGTLKLTSNVGAGSYVANVTNAAFNPNDTFNIELSKTSALTAGSVTVAGVENININVADADPSGSAAVVHTMTLVATSAKKVVVTGNNGLTLTNTGNTAITEFDASGVVANGTAGLDTAANLAVTFTSANNTATANVTIIGGDGNDVLTGGAAKDNINGGKGNDVITGGLGQDTIQLGQGRDVVKIASNSDSNVATSDSHTGTFDIITGFNLLGAITTATNLSSVANFQSATAGGANANMLVIDFEQDDGGPGNGTDLPVVIKVNGTGSGQAAGVTYTVTNGILTLSGTGASAVDTLGEWLAEAAAVAATNGEVLAFVFGGDTYVFGQNGAQDILVQLVGVQASALALAAASATYAAGTLLIGDSL
ncbi:S-layer protein [Tepidimonas ignava]|uniref:S-layer protein n=1 Tax=Tepidimonas ignava TaxID=114249 RepID=A0A4V2UW99_9BURK|nr:DUF4214 domain-containing protein [Tepidimonas ignava]TCS98797.1 S-layer protein [Tepidimonas ignava]TSE20278.1 S-layer protein [Tepidimonas ignava]